MDIERTPLDRRALLRRMAAGGAVVWASPMMQSVASAQAAASCGPGIIDWDTFATGSVFTNTIVGNTTVSMAVSGVANTTLQPDNGRILAGPAGGLNQKHLRFTMSSDNGTNNNGSRQTVTFSFTNPVTNLAFTFFDIDNQTGNGWGDRLVMNTAGYTSSIPAGGLVIGTGTNADRFRNSNANLNLANTDNRGNLTIQYAGPISSFSFTYRNQVSTNSIQLISIGDMTFTC